MEERGISSVSGALGTPSGASPTPTGATSTPAGMLVAARTDAELARVYLDHGEFAATTRRHHEKEIGRFLLWCHDMLGKRLAQLSVDDLIQYREMLRNPPPDLVSTTRAPRLVNGTRNPNYRPFSGPLSDASRRQAILAVKGFLHFAQRAGYLTANPGALLKNVKTTLRGARVTRYLPADLVEQVLNTLRSRAEAARTPAQRRGAARDLFMVSTYWATGARLDELVQARMGDVYREDDGRWWLDVIGKGSRYRRLPIDETVVALLIRYRTAFGMAAATRRDDATPLLLSSRGDATAGITAQAAALAVKAAFAATAGRLEQADEVELAEHLRRASTHWLRHSMLSWHANVNAVPIQVLQATAGHADIHTTAGYLHVEDKIRHDLLVRARSTGDAGTE